MELIISIFFSKLNLSPSQELKNCLIELIYENKTESTPYPMSKPLTLKLSQKSDRQIVSIYIKSKQSIKTQKILAHGELIIFKKLLLEKPQEKYLILFSKEKENDRVKLNKDNIGKILVQMKLCESNNNKISKKEIKIKINDKSNKKETKNDIKNDIIFEDNILDIKSNIIKKKEIELYYIDDIISIESINKLKEILENEEYKNNIYPKDINSLKIFNEKLFKQYKELNDNYYNILLNIIKNNEEIKQKAKNYYNDFIQSENELYKIRLESKQIKDEIKQKEIENNEKKDNISKNIEDMKIQKKKLFAQINNKDKNNKHNNYGDENDLKNICNLIRKIKSLGYNINKTDIADNERRNLDDLLNNENNFKNNNEENKIIKDGQNLDKNERNKENYELGNIIVSLIERDVNDLYTRKLIEEVKIDQIDNITYSFSGDNKEKQVVFTLENNNLLCSTGETFTIWLIKNFSL